MKSEEKARRFNQLANDYAVQMKYSQAIIYYKQSLSLYLSLAKNNPKEYSLPIAHIFSNLSIIYKGLEKDERADELHQNALKMYRVLTKTNHHKYAADLVVCLIDGVRYLNEHTFTLYEAKIVLNRMQPTKKRDDFEKIIHKLNVSLLVN